MTDEQFRPIFNRLYDCCQHRDDKEKQRRYENLYQTFWNYYKDIRDTRWFDLCVQSYLENATTPWMPTLGEVLAYREEAKGLLKDEIDRVEKTLDPIELKVGPPHRYRGPLEPLCPTCKSNSWNLRLPVLRNFTNEMAPCNDKWHEEGEVIATQTMIYEEADKLASFEQAEQATGKPGTGEGPPLKQGS